MNYFQLQLHVSFITTSSMLKTKVAIKIFVTGKVVSHKWDGISDKATLKTEIIVYYLVQVDGKMTVIYNSFTNGRNNATVSIFLFKSFLLC